MKKHRQMLEYFTRMANSIGHEAPLAFVDEESSIVQFDPAIWTAEEVSAVLHKFGETTVLDDGNSSKYGLIKVIHKERN
jgi:hypothetical protein